ARSAVTGELNGSARPLLLVQRTFAAGLVDLDDRVPQALDPVGLVHADQSHTPGQGVAPAPGHAAGHKRVQDLALRHPQPGHDRDAGGGEELELVSAPRPPAHLLAERALRIAGDADAILP